MRLFFESDAFTCKLQQVSFNDNQCKILISNEFIARKAATINILCSKIEKWIKTALKSLNLKIIDGSFHRSIQKVGF